ncbi:MAG: alcohol dehydrogenase catalytic domain-containing protein [Dehalococcoidales bacterium]|nr:alcohol dehydrogenase catalytic domain-containing protein [Dehalococcoidales bacterium]
MKAMVLKELCEVMVPGKAYRGSLPLKAEPLELAELPVPQPGRGEVLIRVLACGICRTELDQIEGRISPPRLPVVPGAPAGGGGGGVG